MSSADLPGPTGQIHLFLCRPRKFITPVTARYSDTCAILAPLFPQERLAFIFSGQILSPEVPFSAYGLKSHDAIVVIPDRGTDIGLCEAQEWIRTTQDQTAFDDRLYATLDRSVSSESMRLRDISVSKTELRPRQWRRSMRKYWDNELSAESSTASAKSVIGEVPTKLSTAELPQLW
jgi:hypothetical protein